MVDFQKCCEPGYTLLNTSGIRLPKVCSVLLTDNPALEISLDSPTSTLNGLLENTVFRLLLSEKLEL